ncbi:TetR/AcrR family transcriptional regulator [Burkholderia multivorans]|uniref:TetR/AcrR family transcriptional regulator n=1 Tax=Burkholderia multivorans TaxID=87883 RepID=UPI002018BB65|nr:TetR/AcrR family transcriptional regulator [Burkholderia multivorans]MCO1374545.1 TetR/AcrR family transcriptional regulator [Burkholderia multivorans]MCO1456174.1 TetR/AcrR family transcriptional regulator [Burkholderia multivorans]MCO1470722.1 TetR/AcrR family transcriptional regulator [Burkholderia multivorans]UQO19657.1 TetR/AcrR family transcriptional regulator [Burkholderia multivorans]UQO82755.1 TetR/AcrR family transcriptional regulator [Burkholderia multivorans]
MNTQIDPSAGPPDSGVRERLLDAAEALIYSRGIHATGVDAIVKRSGAARKSFYSHFESKEALVVAALERRDARWMRWFVDATRARGKSPRAQLLGMFDVLRDWFAQPGFHGCVFLNTSGEIADADDPVRVVAREHKARLLAFVRERLDAYADVAGIERRTLARLARQWLVLIDGAIGVALVSGDAGAARDARAAAELLLDAALRSSTS